MNTDQLKSILGPQLSGKVTDTFEKMEFADKLCCDNGNPPGMFMVLCPSPILSLCRMSVYQHHALELVQRWKDKGDTRFGTKAEVMHLLSDISLKAPMARAMGSLYAKLFQEITKVDLSPYGPDEKEHYEGELDNLLEQLRKKVFYPQRILK